MRLLALVPVIAIVVGAPLIESPPSANDDCVTVFEAGIDGRPQGAVAGPDGSVWFTEPREDRVGRLDPDTGDVERFRLPEGTAPRYPIFTEDGRLWFTGLSDSIGSIDPDTQAVDVFTDGIASGSIPHTPVAPGDGFIYFTQEQAPQLGRLDPETGEIDQIDVPGDEPLHGITASRDGTHLWAAQQDADRVVRFDLASGEFDQSVPFLPGAGPHDVQAGEGGRLYATLQRGGRIGEVDSETSETFEYETGMPPSETPDAQPDLKLVDLTVGPEEDAVFASSFTANRIFRLDLDSKEVTQVVCDIPRGGSSLDIIVGPGGELWYTDPIGGRIVRVDRVGASEQDPPGVPDIPPQAGVPEPMASSQGGGSP